MAASNFPKFNSPATAGYGRNSGAVELDSGMVASGSSLVLRRSLDGVFPGLWRGGVVSPRRRRGCAWRSKGGQGSGFDVVARYDFQRGYGVV